MRTFYDPASLGIATAAFSLVGGAATGLGQFQEAEAAAEDIETQRRRDVRDERVERRRLLSRQRAALASRGVDLQDASGLLVETRRESLLREGRTTADARRAAASTRRRGRSQALGSIFQGARGAGQSLLRGGVI